MSAAAYERLMPQLLAGGFLSQRDARALMAELVRGDLGSARIAAVLTALATRPLQGAELAGFASLLRQQARRVDIVGDTLDTCGTGGSGLSTPNTSTMSAFVLAAAKVPVTKHGNRKSSGRCGSVDVLERLGARVAVGPAAAPLLLEATGIVFLFAPLFHPAVGMVMPVRRELGFRTVFNLIGPLSNPAAAAFAVLGVSDARAAAAMAEALAGLGVKRALVVHGDEGLDELSVSGPSTLWPVEAGVVGAAERVTPEDVGLCRAPLAAVEGGDAQRNVELLRAVLQGRDRGAVADLVAINAGAGLLVAGKVASLSEGVARAQALLADGAPWDIVEAYVAASHATADADDEPSGDRS